MNYKNGAATGFTRFKTPWVYVPDMTSASVEHPCLYEPNTDPKKH